MKQGVKIHIPVLFKNIDLDDVRQIEFVFKKNRSHGAPSFKNELWTSDGSAGNCTLTAKAHSSITRLSARLSAPFAPARRLAPIGKGASTRIIKTAGKRTDKKAKHEKELPHEAREAALLKKR